MMSFSVKKLDRNMILTYIGIAVSAIFLVMAVVFFLSFFKTKEHVINNDMWPGDGMYSMGGISLPAGNYIMSMEYTLTGSDGSANARLAIEQVTGDIVLPLPDNDGNGAPIYFNFVLEHPISNGRLSVIAPEEARFALKKLTVVSDRYIYSDGILYAMLCLIGIVCVFIMIRSIINGSDPILLGCSALLFIITTVPCVCTITQNVGVDLRAHLLRIDGSFFGFMDGQFPVVIAPEWNNRHGQLAILYPSLFVYPFALLRMMRVSLYGTLKIALIVINAISSLVYYKVAKEFFISRSSRLIAMILIALEYTRLYGITYGGKLCGALLAEIFIPLIIAGLIDVLYREGKKWHYLAIGLAGVFCTHILSTVVAVLMIVLFSLFSIKRFAIKSVWTGIAKSVALFIPLIFGVYVAFFRYYFIDWSSSHLKWSEFIDTLWEITSPFFDPRWTNVIVLIVACVIMLAVNKGAGSYVPAAFAAASVLFIMSTVYFPWAFFRRIGFVESFTDILQSGNRFLVTAGMLCAFCLPILLENGFLQSDKKKRVTAITVASLLGLFTVYNLTDAMNWYFHADLDLTDQISTPVDYRYQDYLPTGTQPEYYASDAGVISDDGVVNTLEYSRFGTKVHYRYTSPEDGQYVEFPLFYYDGYQAVDELGNQLVINKSDRNKVQVDLRKTEEAGEINISYVIPRYVTICYIFTVIAWIITLAVIMIREKSFANKVKSYE